MEKMFTVGMTAVVISLLAAIAAYGQEAPPPQPGGFPTPLPGECMPHELMTAGLMQRYGEVSVSVELIPETGTALQVFINPKERKTFTVVEVYPDHLACYRAFNLTPWNYTPMINGQPARGS